MKLSSAQPQDSPVMRWSCAKALPRLAPADEFSGARSRYSSTRKAPRCVLPQGDESRRWHHGGGGQRLQSLRFRGEHRCGCDRTGLDKKVAAPVGKVPCAMNRAAADGLGRHEGKRKSGAIVDRRRNGVKPGIEAWGQSDARRALASARRPAMTSRKP